MKIMLTDPKTDDSVEFASYEDIEDIIVCLEEAKKLIEDMLTSGIIISLKKGD